MFFVENKSVKYHVAATILRSMMAMFLLKLGYVFGSRLQLDCSIDRSFFYGICEVSPYMFLVGLLPFMISALCYLRLVYEDYREIWKRYPKVPFGYHYRMMILMAQIMASSIYDLFTDVYATAGFAMKMLCIGSCVLPALALFMKAWRIVKLTEGRSKALSDNESVVYQDEKKAHGDHVNHLYSAL